MAAKGASKKNRAVYVISGKDTSLTAGKCRALTEKLLGDSQKETALLSVDADKAQPADVFDELRTLPFLADKRLVVIKSADKFVSAHRDKLLNYFDNPSGSGILILTVSSWSARTRLAKKLPSIGEHISMDPPKRSQLPGKMSDYARSRYGKVLSMNSARLLVELSGDSLAVLCSDVDKLALYCGPEKEITVSHIEKLISNNRFYNVFAVIDAASAGNVAGAVDRIRSMFAEDKSSEYTFIGAFAFHFRRLFNAKILYSRGVNASQISSRLRIWGNREAFFSQLRRLSLRQIGSGIEYLAETDHAIKTGHITPGAAAEQLIFRFLPSAKS